MPSVEVMLFGKKHVFETAGNPDRVRAAAILLERKVNTVSEHFGMISNERTLILAGLNLAEELIRLKQETRLDRVEDFLRGLSDRLELTLQSIREDMPAATPK